MGLQWPDVIYADGNLDVAAAVGLPVFTSPVRATTAEYVFTQDWMQSRRAFRPTPLNTSHPSARQTPDYSAYKLVMEGPRQDVGGGMVKWSRTYARVPESHDEFESYSYSFIGFLGSWTVGNVGTSTQATGRPRVAHVVTSRVQHDYFLVDPTGAYPTPQDIPLIKAQRYLAPTVGPVAKLDSEYIWDASAAIPLASIPSRTEYDALVEAESELVAEDSRLSRWMGSLWLRTTRYVQAI